MSFLDDERATQLRISLLEVVESCPYLHDNPEDCPLFQLRKQNATQRRRWIKALNPDDLVWLAAYHRVCLNAKLHDEETATAAG